MKKVIMSLLALQLTACASASVAKNFSMLTFDEKATSADIRSVGNVEGKDCTWYVWGYPIGEDPSLRNAFQNAMEQKEVALLPGQAAVSKGTPLKAVKNVTVEQGGFNAWIASRSCVVVTAVGLQ